MTAVQTAGAASLTAAGQRESAASQYRVGRVCFLNMTASSFPWGRNRVLELDEGKPSRPVLIIEGWRPVMASGYSATPSYEGAGGPIACPTEG